MKPIDANTIAAVADMIRGVCDDLDDATLFDTLDGETDAGEIMDALIAEAQHAEAMDAAIGEQAKALAARRARYAARHKAARQAMLTILKAADVRKVERPGATVSQLAGRVRAVVDDVNDVPTQLCVIERKADTAAIKKALQAGEDVPGAHLETGPDSVSMRVA
jgi:hypothetical protein